jgi:hypothetical protein
MGDRTITAVLDVIAMSAIFPVVGIWAAVQCGGVTNSTSTSGRPSHNRHPTRSPRDEEARREKKMSKSNTALRVATLALLAVAIGGCSKHQQSDAQSTATPTSPSAAAQPTVAEAQPVASAGDTGAQPASAAPAAAAASDTGIASTDGDQAGTKFVVNSLVRSPDTLTLKFTLVNNSSKVLTIYGRFDADPYRGYRTMSNIHLIDPLAKKKYFPIADTDRRGGPGKLD